MGHAQKTDFVFLRNGRVNLNRRGRQFSRLLAAEVCASAVVMPDTPCSEVVWRVLATHSIRQFPHHFPSRASPFAITFQLDSTTVLDLFELLFSDRLISSLRLLSHIWCFPSAMHPGWGGVDGWPSGWGPLLPNRNLKCTDFLDKTCDVI
jgi:hypothetical protein